jgi:hypothetical protein
MRETPEASSSSAHPALTELEEIIARRPLSDELHRIYKSTITELKKSFGQAESLASSSSAGAPAQQFELIDPFIWVFNVAEDFMPLLREPAQEAVAIFAFFCVLLRKLDGQWWMQGWGRRLLAHAYELLDEEGRLWIHWAVQEMGWVPPPAVERF